MMSSPHSITVNLTRSVEVQQVVPRPPLFTSESAGWNNILVHHHRQPSWEMPENSVTQHVVVVHHNQSPVARVMRKMDGIRRHESLHSGSCIVIPSMAPHQSAWDHEVEFTLLILEPTYLAQLAFETVDGDRIELIPQFARLDPVISGIGLSLRMALETDGVAAKLYAESATTFLSAHLLRHYCTRTALLTEYGGGLPKYKLKEAIAYIENHLSEEISLAAIAKHLHMSQYYFCHLFKQSMGISPYQYVLRQRIEKAKRLIKQRQFTIVDVALECGFANQTHFTKHFRKITGTTPGAYRHQ